MFAFLDYADFFWIAVIVCVVGIGTTGFAARNRLVRLKQYRALETQLRRLEEKVNLLLKYTDLSEGDKALLGEIDRLLEPPA